MKTLFATGRKSPQQTLYRWSIAAGGWVEDERETDMKVWRVISSDTATWRGTGEEYQLRWQAEDAYRAAQGPGKIVTLAEFVNGRMVEIVRSSQFESHSQREG